jgi:hypothetical protein
MYNLVVNLYYEKDIARFGLKRAKIAKIIIFHVSAIYTTKHVFYDVMGLIFRKCNSLNKFNIKISSKLCNILSIQNKMRKISFFTQFYQG